MEKKEKPYLSSSQIGMYERCGEQYRRRYIEKQIIPPSFSLLKGSAVHVAAEMNFKQKIESHKDLSRDDVVDMAAASFEGKYSQEGVFLDDEDTCVNKAQAKGNYLDSTVTSAKCLADLVLPRYQPLVVEEKVRLEIPGSPYDLLGILDLVWAGGVQDLKNTARKKSQNDVDKETQFTIYSVLYRAKYGTPPAEIAIDNIVHKPGSSKDAEHLRLTTTRAKCDFDVLAARINSAIKGIQAGVFNPATPGAWWCSQKSCGYHLSCPYTAK